MAQVAVTAIQGEKVGKMHMGVVGLFAFDFVSSALIDSSLGLGLA